MPTGVILGIGSKKEFVFANGDGHIYGLDPATGRLLWQRPIPGVDMMSSLEYSAGLIYGSSHIAAEPTVREQRVPPCPAPDIRRCYRWTWAIQPNGQMRWHNPWGFGDASPVIGERKVFTESIVFPPDEESGGTVHEAFSEIYASDVDSGKLLWRHRSPLGMIGESGELAVGGLYHSHRLYISLPHNNQFVAFNSGSGKILWTLSTANAVKMSAVIKDDILYFGDMDGYLYLVNAASGKLLQRVKFSDTFQSSPPVIVGDTFFVANGTCVYALPLEDLKSGHAPNSE